MAYVAGANEGHGAEAFVGSVRGDSNLAARRHSGTPALRDFATASGLLGQACDVGASIVVTLKVAVIGQLALIDAALNLAVAEIMGT